MSLGSIRPAVVIDRLRAAAQLLEEYAGRMAVSFDGTDLRELANDVEAGAVDDYEVSLRCRCLASVYQAISGKMAGLSGAIVRGQPEVRAAVEEAFKERRGPSWIPGANRKAPPSWRKRAEAKRKKGADKRT